MTTRDTPEAALAAALHDSDIGCPAPNATRGACQADWHETDADLILAALDAAGFAVVPKDTAKRDLEECLRQNGYAIDLVQRNERLQEALDEWERMARQEAKEWNDKHI